MSLCLDAGCSLSCKVLSLLLLSKVAAADVMITVFLPGASNP